MPQTNRSETLMDEQTQTEGETVSIRAQKADVITFLKKQQPRETTTFQVLTMSLFQEELRRERSRSDRSKAPLSLLIIQLKADSHIDPENLQSVLFLLHHKLRALDSIGLLEPNVLALLLPDTDEDGAQSVADKVIAQNNSHISSIKVTAYPDKLFESLQQGAQPEDNIESILLLNTPISRPTQSALKRSLDIFGALVGLLVLSPLMLIIMALIKLTSPGPTIFRQVRLGKDFVPFTFYKFRSMHTGADDRVHRDYLKNLINGNDDAVNQEATGEAVYKIKSDSRITRIGRFIRKTSIDELPQLFNVLKGEMSLVGPRPPIPYEAESYQPWHLRRILEVKPGLTGLWQVEGRSKTTFDEMVRMDLSYSREWSVLLDMKLIFRTVRVVVDCRGGM